MWVVVALLHIKENNSKIAETGPSSILIVLALRPNNL